VFQEGQWEKRLGVYRPWKTLKIRDWTRGGSGLAEVYDERMISAPEVRLKGTLTIRMRQARSTRTRRLAKIGGEGEVARESLETYLA